MSSADPKACRLCSLLQYTVTSFPLNPKIFLRTLFSDIRCQLHMMSDARKQNNTLRPAARIRGAISSYTVESRYYQLFQERDIVVTIATRLRYGQSGVPIPAGKGISPQNNRATLSWETELFLRQQSGQTVVLTTTIYLVPMLRMNGVNTFKTIEFLHDAARKKIASTFCSCECVIYTIKLNVQTL